MPRTADQIANLDAELDALSTPTTADVLAHSQDYDTEVVAASAAARAINGGGGGGGGSSPGALVAREFVFTEEATADSVQHAITAANTGDSTFRVAGLHADEFPPGAPFAVVGSTGNDGLYTVFTIEEAGGNTTITVNETVADATADGTIQYGLYRATLAIPARATVLDVQVFPEAVEEAGVKGWTADKASIIAGDSANVSGYWDASAGNGNDVLGGTLVSVYDPLAASRNVNWCAAADNDGFSGGYANVNGHSGSAVGLGLLTATIFEAMGALPSGVPYPAGDTVTISVYTAIATPPVVPAGVARFRVLYLTAPTETAVGLS